jgi:Fur family peroxide stress response transcriptional regulator
VLRSVPDSPDHVLELLRSSGLRCTPQRYDVLNYLAVEPVHATADEIYSTLNRHQPRVSRATVYNTLKELTCAGLLREFPSEGSAARYDGNLNPHHHFVCDQCGAVEDVEWFDLPHPFDQSAGQSGLGGHNIRSYDVVFRGTCRLCSSQAAGCPIS